MIVPMKKVTIIVQERDSEEAIKDLRALGLLHVEHHQLPQGKDVRLLQEDTALVNVALSVFRQTGFAPKQKEVSGSISGDWKVRARHIIELLKRYEHLEGYSRTLMNAINEWQLWGDFEPQKIKELSGEGIIIKLYQIPVKQIHEFPPKVIVQLVRTSAGTAYCAAIARRPFDVPFKEIPLPRQSLSAMRQRLTEDKKVMAAIQEEIGKAKSTYAELLRVHQGLQKDIEFYQVLCGMGKEGQLAYVSGYAPEETAAVLSRNAQERKWGLLLAEPDEEDNVPTLLRNPRWVDVISPVFKLLGITPGYRELDISPVFLSFLSLFFGMIIGDAGYGTVYFLLSFWLHQKLGKKLSDTRIFYLLYIFSACAIFWGLLTGTFFGQEWYLKAGMKPFMPILNDTKFLQAFCFFLGALHLTLAHAWQAVRKIPSLVALSDAGWICVLWAAFLVAKTLILNDPFPFLGKWLIIAGLSLVIFCTNPQRNILKTIGGGLGAVALSLMNNFTDVVSYVRLFAVGLAGVAIADTVNALAASLGSGNALARALIVFAGHTVNIILGLMSVLVHGIRLNVLEFSGHAGLSWSGIVYKPLKD